MEILRAVFFKTNGRKIVGTVLLCLIFTAVTFAAALGAPEKNAPSEWFVVPRTMERNDVSLKLEDEGFIKSTFAWRAALSLSDGSAAEPGGYRISKSMSGWRIARVIASPPDMRWVVIPEGLRKEEIADVVAEGLGWSESQKRTWFTTDTAFKSDYVEGVYFPDTYLVPVTETTHEVAARMIRRFNEKFAPYAEEAAKQNIKWTTVVKVASLVQREAAGKKDMPLIAGVVWNRLAINMRLDIDASVQYARGKTAEGWWAPIRPADKQIDSPFNTYKYKGLPPRPISNPGEEAIKATLFPQQTECLYYLHDRQKNIYCAETLEAHKKNIEKYLR